MQLLTRLIPADMLAGMPFLHGLGLNVRVLAFAGAISLLAAVLFSITPTVHLSSSEMREGLAEGSRGSAGNTWRRLGSKLVVLELATAMVLLAGAGLLGKSLYRLLHVDIGLQPDHLVTLDVAAPSSGYAKDEQAIALERQVMSRIASLPGVKSVGISSDLPVNGWGNTTWFRVLGRPWHGEHNEVPERDVSSDYFTTLGAKLLRGRYFSEAEDASKPRVAIVNQAFAKTILPRRRSYRQTALVPLDTAQAHRDRGHRGRYQGGPAGYGEPAVLYIVLLTRAQETISPWWSVRRKPSSRCYRRWPPRSIRSTPALLPGGGTTMRDKINHSPSAYLHRSSAWLVGGFAALALLLGVVGLYGVVAYSVSQRTREIGVRMALGAQRGSVYRLILKEAGWLTAVGIVIGLACSVAAANLMRGLLFGVRSWDVPTLAAVAAVLGIAALLASYIPARRAASVNPVEALRAE